MQKKIVATSAMVGQNLPPPPPGWNRVKVSENLGTTAVIPVATVDAFLNYTMYFTFNNLQRSILNFHFMNLMLKTIFQGELFEMCK